VDDVLERCRRAWPTLRVDGAAFLAHVGELANQAHVEDLYLAYACAIGLPEAHKIFAENYLVLVPRQVAQVNPATSFGAEVQQDLAEKLLVGPSPRIGMYRAEGPLGAWVRIAAIRTARSMVRKKTEDARTDEIEEIRSPSLDPELDLMKRVSSAVFSEAFRATLATLDVDARNVLRLHYVDGLSVEEVARSYRVSRATANRMLKDARETIVNEVKRRLSERTGTSITNPGALLSLVQSQLDVSIRRHLDFSKKF
jgi:RNA polymerase sigma-70 factor (ECF subfamily)